MTLSLRDYYPMEPVLARERTIASLERRTTIEEFSGWGQSRTRLWRQILAIIPPFGGARRYLRLSVFVILLCSFLFPGITDGVGSGALSDDVSRNITRAIDPSYLTLASAALLVLLLVRIAMAQSSGFWMSLAAAIAVVGAILLFEFALDRYVLKQAIGLPRPADYDPSRNPPVIQWVHDLLGAGPGVPSGSVARQVVIACLTLWVVRHPNLRFGSAMRALVGGTSVLLVLVVGLLRIEAGAHDFGGAAIGVSSGLLQFWIIVVVLGAGVHREARELLPELRFIWGLVLLGWLIASDHPWAVGVILVVGSAALITWENVIRATTLSALLSRRRLTKVSGQPTKRSSVGMNAA